MKLPYKKTLHLSCYPFGIYSVQLFSAFPTRLSFPFEAVSFFLLFQSVNSLFGSLCFLFSSLTLYECTYNLSICGINSIYAHILLQQIFKNNERHLLCVLGLIFFNFISFPFLGFKFHAIPL